MSFSEGEALFWPDTPADRVSSTEAYVASADSDCDRIVLSRVSAAAATAVAHGYFPIHEFAGRSVVAAADQLCVGRASAA